MNRFLKSNSPWLGLLGLALIVVLLAYIFRPKYPEYKTTVNQSLHLVADNSKQVTVSDIPGKQLIDIRTENLFEQGHAANAINIPLRQILDKENMAFFKKLLGSGKEAILYGNDELEATAPWLLLQQLGYTNLNLLKGGYAARNGFTTTSLSMNETPVVDPTLLLVKPVPVKPEITKPEKVQELVVPVRKAVSSGGGC